MADWAIEAIGDGVVALGLGGVEAGYSAVKFKAVFERARAAGLARTPHAGETVGADSIWSAVRALDATRIGHGVRCLEDPALVEHLRARQIPLEVCPSSNVCLGVAPSMAAHPLPQLLAAGLCVTINSDDPPMFNTTLTRRIPCGGAGIYVSTPTQSSCSHSMPYAQRSCRPVRRRGWKPSSPPSSRGCARRCSHNRAGPPITPVSLRRCARAVPQCVITRQFVKRPSPTVVVSFRL